MNRYQDELIKFNKLKDAMCGAFCNRGRQCRSEAGSCVLLKLRHDNADMYRIRDFLVIPKVKVKKKRVYHLRKPQMPKI